MKTTIRGTISHEICILAGGLSKRMGRDKSRLLLGGRSMLGQIRAEAIRTRSPVRVIRRDLVRRCGPLGGVYTALTTTRAKMVVFLACDMPFVAAELIEWLMAQCDAQARSGQGGGAFASRNGKAGFPFVLLRKALQAVQAQIQAGEFSLQALAKILKARLLPLPHGWGERLRNVNTPSEWKRARRIWAAHESRNRRRRLEGKHPGKPRPGE